MATEFLRLHPRPPFIAEWTVTEGFVSMSPESVTQEEYEARVAAHNAALAAQKAAAVARGEGPGTIVEEGTPDDMAQMSKVK